MTAKFRALGFRGSGFWGFKVSGLGFRVMCVHLGYSSYPKITEGSRLAYASMMRISGLLGHALLHVHFGS